MKHHENLTLYMMHSQKDKWPGMDGLIGKIFTN